MLRSVAAVSQAAALMAPPKQSQLGAKLVALRRARGQSTAGPAQLEQRLALVWLAHLRRRRLAERSRPIAKRRTERRRRRCR